MRFAPRIIVIGLLVLAIGLWVGLDRQRPPQLATNCDARLNWCTGEEKGVMLQVSQATGELQTNKDPTTIHIQLSGTTSNSLIGRISGANMYMGQFDVGFKLDQDGQLHALTSLPSCAEAQTMVWRLDLMNGDDTDTKSSNTFFFSSPTR